MFVPTHYTMYQAPNVGPVDRIHMVKHGAEHGPRDNWLLQDVLLQPLQGPQGPRSGPPLFFHADTWLGGGGVCVATLTPSMWVVIFLFP